MKNPALVYLGLSLVSVTGHQGQSKAIIPITKVIQNLEQKIYPHHGPAAHLDNRFLFPSGMTQLKHNPVIPADGIAESGSRYRSDGFRRPLAFITDFGLEDGAVGVIKAVALEKDPKLQILDITHQIPNFDIWTASLRLKQAVPYMPKGTVIVGVVDPGVGTTRKSIAIKTHAGNILVGPDNGLFSAAVHDHDIAEVRVIDDAKYGLPSIKLSPTFHGRDLYSPVGALLASGKVPFENIGERLESPITRLNFPEPVQIKDQLIGNIMVHDPAYGNVWTNIPTNTLPQKDKFQVQITHGNQVIFDKEMLYLPTFGKVDPKQEFAYINSIGDLALAVNQDSFAKKFGVGFGPDWKVSIK